MIMYPELIATIKSLTMSEISSDRKVILQQIIDYIKSKKVKNELVKLNFICTHNSRRSQLAQIWAQTAADYYELNIACYSGGVDVTAFNNIALETITQAGFKVSIEGNDNPICLVSYSKNIPPITAFSKLYDDMVNPTDGFAAIMTCSDADENCPFISGAEVRIPLLYDDPKEYDNTPLANEMYDERSRQIAGEIFYLFSQVNI